MPKGFDIGWDHAIRIPGNKNETQYKYCDKILAGGGITRLKLHLGEMSKNVEKCLKCGKEIRDMFRQIIESGIDKRNEKNKAQEHYKAAMYAHPPGEDSDEDDYEFEMARQQSRDEHQRFCEEGSWDRRAPTKENTNVPSTSSRKGKGVMSFFSRSKSTRHRELIDVDSLRRPDVYQPSAHQMTPADWTISFSFFVRIKAHPTARLLQENMVPHFVQACIILGNNYVHSTSNVGESSGVVGVTS